MATKQRTPPTLDIFVTSALNKSTIRHFEKFSLNGAFGSAKCFERSRRDFDSLRWPRNCDLYFCPVRAAIPLLNKNPVRENTPHVTNTRQ